MNSDILKSLRIDFPLIMAPMFLVSNLEMMKAGIQAGILSVFPSLNFRKEGELESVIDSLHEYRQGFTTGNFGVNIIVQKSNPLSARHLKICLEKKVPFFITSLGSPKEVIEGAHAYGGKVYCDITNLAHAQKCFDLGCDGFIAVGQGAGGHAGANPLQVLIPALKEKFPEIPVIAAGGIATGAGLLSVQALGAFGASVGTRFIASKEAGVNDSYKEAIVDSGMEDIVMTTRLSGTPCSVINTETAKKMGYSQNFFERWLSNNPRTKKWFKMFVQVQGMKKLEKSVLPNNYNRLWTAGKSSELVHEIASCDEIIRRFKQEHKLQLESLNNF